MKDIDYLRLDGKTLKTFITVFNEMSVSKAAVALSVSQSSVSHTLDKLRETFGDPLFVRSGRNIIATERAVALKGPAESILLELKSMTQSNLFDPILLEFEHTIAANDYQYGIIFPALLNQFDNEGIAATFTFVDSGRPSALMLNHQKCDLVVTPYPPNGSNICQVRLFTDRIDFIYEKNERSAPQSIAEVSSSKLVKAFFNRPINEYFDDDPEVNLEATVIVPNFNSIVSFVAGSKRLGVMSSHMADLKYPELGKVELQNKTKNFTMYMAWHKSNQQDSSHKWLRHRIKLIIKQQLALISKTSACDLRNNFSDTQ